MKKRIANKIRKAWLLFFEYLQEAGAFYYLVDDDIDNLSWIISKQHFKYVTKSGYHVKVHELLRYNSKQVYCAMKKFKYDSDDKRIGWPALEMIIRDIMRKWQTWENINVS